MPDQNILFGKTHQILTSSGPGLKIGYPVPQGPLPKMRRMCTNFSSVFTNLLWSRTLFHCSNLYTQHGNQFHTNIFRGVEHGPTSLVWERKFVIKKKQKVSVSFTIPLWFTTKRSWQDICHIILLPSYVKRRLRQCYPHFQPERQCV